MQELDDNSLLREYVERDSQEAFATLVARHVNKVYSVALRHTRNPHSAEEITQAVFVILATKANKLFRHAALSGWLYETARLTAMTFIRSEIRRAKREQEAHMETLPDENESATWMQIAPLLDAAMAGLGETDRHAIVLRFFDGKSMKEIGAILGASEDATKMRVSRALEKLQKYFRKRGVTSTAATIAGTISANSVQAAPVGLAKTISAVALAKGAAASTSTLTLVKGALKIMAWTKMKTAVVTAVIIVCAVGGSTGIYVYHKSHLDAAEKLKAALDIKKPATGTWAYPSEKVERAVYAFGSNRADAFPILEEAIKSSNLETRKQAVSALWFVGAPFRPERAKYGLVGEPSPKVVPLLWQILNSDDGELSSFALTTLRGIGFEPENIPVLAALLVRSHGDSLSKKSLAIASVAQAQNFLDRANNDQQLQRYIPEAIADTIRKNPEAAAPFVSSVEDLLDDANADVRFDAACALAEYKGVGEPKISAELKSGLASRHDNSRPYPGTEGLKQLMAIETLQRVGPKAQSMIPALLEFARSRTTDDKTLREHAFAAIGYIDSNLRNTMPEVGQAVEDDMTFKSSIVPQ